MTGEANLATSSEWLFCASAREAAQLLLRMRGILMNLQSDYFAHLQNEFSFIRSLSITSIVCTAQ